MSLCLLPHRRLMRVSGSEAGPFLDNLLTADVGGLEQSEARFAALLTPQGKIISDMFVVKDQDGYWIDYPSRVGDTLLKRLLMYRLRSKVDMMDGSENDQIVAGWQQPLPQQGAAFTDPRLSTLGWRAIVPLDAGLSADVAIEAYNAHRVALGVPEGGRDFAYGDAFPHEADMDQLHGVDFHKGCYVGQEVVSRMQHRAIARTRVVPVRFVEGLAAPEGTEAVAAGKVLGRIGSTGANGQALALLRLDRVSDAVTAGEPLTAGGLAFKLERRDWIQFELPGTL